MSEANLILDYAVDLSLWILSLSFLVTLIRVIRGPTLPDRVLALDMLVAVAIGFIAVIGIKTGYVLYVDIAIALGLVGFLTTVAFARFILTRGKTEDDLLEEHNQAERLKNRPPRHAPARGDKQGEGAATAERPSASPPTSSDASAPTSSDATKERP
ncbi:cation:proton antiporter [Pseudohoeflea coraliihabitans]|uniref:Cation:proton antiporter n=1 Tax=Pseudohoeflea coraliihabitans TaxID=2860393 RepID=A0ABS6WT90_9HYPH|nr:cation:proton antiporter [Pseudohoeflea sp. DP4N28-3]MBW3098637.1 cation:proton antiporter [Pseudohoeflea sp. DP4N28-3]